MDSLGVLAWAVSLKGAARVQEGSFIIGGCSLWRSTIYERREKHQPPSLSRTLMWSNSNENKSAVLIGVSGTICLNYIPYKRKFGNFAIWIAPIIDGNTCMWQNSWKHIIIQAFWQGARVRNRTIRSNPHNNAQSEKICKIPHNTEKFTEILNKTGISIEYQDF